MRSFAPPTVKLLALALSLMLVSSCGNGSGDAADTTSIDVARPTAAASDEPGNAPSAMATVTPTAAPEVPGETEPHPSTTTTATPMATTEVPAEATPRDPSLAPTQPAPTDSPGAATCPRRCPNNCGQIYEPVCGADGCTYGNRCEALCAGVSILSPGRCDARSATPTPTPLPTEVPTAAETTIFPGCESLQRESHYCLAMAGGSIQLLGLDSGDVCPVTSTDAPIGGFLVSGSIAWLEDHVHVCGGSGLIRIALDDGSWEMAGEPCLAVASYDGGLLVKRDRFGGAAPDPFGHPLAWYPDYDAVRAGHPARTFALGGFSATMAVQSSTLYTAWHAGISVDVADLTDGRSLGVLTLDDYNGWMLGMSVTEDGYLALVGYDGLSVFDVHDGRRIQRLDVRPSALACVVGRTASPRDTPTPTPTVRTTPTSTPCWWPDCPDPCAELPLEPEPFRLYELPPSMPNGTNCLGGYGSSNYALPDDLLVANAAAELHVIGVYEARGNPGFRPHAQGVVDVVIRERPKPVVLALSSYQGMLWRVSLQPGARLARVILQGYEPQEVEGVPDGVPVEHRDAYAVCGYAYGWEVWHNGGGGSYESMIKDLRRATGLIETSFQGCYSGATFEIPHWSGQPPIGAPTPVAGDETLRREAVRFPGCEQVTAESEYCLTTTYSGVALLGLDTGNVCPLTATSAGVGHPHFASIAWRGELMYACTDAGLVRISLRDGSWESSQIACGGVGEYEDGLLVAASIADPSKWLGDSLHAYPDYAAVLARQPSRTFAVGAGTTRFTVDGSTLYGAWHSTDTIDVADLNADELRPPIRLDGYDGWILGMSILDGQLAISGDIWGDTVRIFDAQTGQRLRDVRPAAPVHALSCVAPAR